VLQVGFITCIYWDAQSTKHKPTFHFCIIDHPRKPHYIQSPYTIKILHLYNLFKDTVSSSDNIRWYKIINEWWIRMDIEGNDIIWYYPSISLEGIHTSEEQNSKPWSKQKGVLQILPLYLVAYCWVVIKTMDKLNKISSLKYSTVIISADATAG
jgi:hypothetical protein